MQKPSILTAALLAWGIAPAPAPASANELVTGAPFPARIATPRGPSAPIDTWLVASLVSKPGQTKDQFISDVAQFLDGWTMRSGMEACAHIAASPTGDQWGVRILTQKSQVNCITSRDQVPFDFVSTGETIHSHPQAENRQLVLNENSARLLGILSGKRVREGDRFALGNVRSFSPSDLASGAGYLVAEGKLMHQQGPGTEQELGEVRTSFAGP